MRDGGMKDGGMKDGGMKRDRTTGRRPDRDLGRLGILTRVTRRHLWLFTGDVLVGIVFFLCALVPGLALRDFLNQLPGSDALWGVPLAPLLAYVGFKVANALGAAAWMAVDTVFRYRVYTDVRTNLLRQMFARPAALPLQVPAGDVLTRFREDTVEVAEVLGKRGIQLVTSSLVLSGGSLAVLFVIDVRVTVLAVLPTLALAVIAFVVSKEIKRLRAVNLAAASSVSAFLRECFAGIETIKISGAADAIGGRVRELNATRRRAAVRDGVFGGVLASTQGFVTLLGSALVMVVVADGIQDGTFLVGDFALFVYTLGNLGTLVAAIGNFVSRYQRFSVTRGRLAELTPSGTARAVVTPVRDPAEASGPAPVPGNARPTGAGPTTAPDVVPGAVPDVVPGAVLVVDDLSYTHPNGAPCFSGVGLTAAAGDIVLVTGQVGAGKTTLVRTLLGLLPRSGGTVTILGEQRAPGEAFTPPLAGYTPQVPHVFSGALHENVLLGRPRHDLDAALEASTLARDLPHLSDGADTEVGPSGHRLSGGQLHRLAAARMLAHPAAVRVIDDLSASLDVETERLLVQRVVEDSRDGVLVVVSNRPLLRGYATQVIDLDGH
ncbi:ABC transporter transmembrane domain-containing protein [Promicromonospora sp. NPDC057488]|uniref:ABC transporter transmembrane domain-containing protein n=1 Tax=Promicromonospora sp. NPDC057488 TaxID=3346147 RepID=UPI00366C79A4